MSDKAIVVKGLSKRYDLGSINSGTLTNDLKLAWAKLRGHENPISIIGDKSKSGEYWALNDVSFEIKKGESVGIIGKNGAGKSTLLKILSRVTAPTQGKIKIKGRIASLLEVGTGFHPDLSGRENIFMNGAILGMTRHEISNKLDEIIAFSGVEKYIDTPVKRYSSGMYVRLAFAVAAHLESEILIVDEVLAVGDAEFQKKCLGKMNDVSTKDGRTVLFVSHNIGAIAELCNSTLVLKNGNVVFRGNTPTGISTYTQLNTGSSGSANTYIANQEQLDIKPYCIKKVVIKDQKGDTKNTFLFDESVFIEITAISNGANFDSDISLILLNKSQQRVFTVHKKVESANTEIKLLAKLPASLFAPNFYSFRIVTLVHNKVIYDDLESVCPIQIIDNGTGNALLEGLDYGNVIVNVEWQEQAV